MTTAKTEPIIDLYSVTCVRSKLAGKFQHWARRLTDRKTQRRVRKLERMFRSFAPSDQVPIATALLLHVKGWTSENQRASVITALNEVGRR